MYIYHFQGDLALMGDPVFLLSICSFTHVNPVGILSFIT